MGGQAKKNMASKGGPTGKLWRVRGILNIKKRKLEEV